MSLLHPREGIAEGALACPRDGAALSKLHAHGVVLDRCGKCRGTWFDKAELRRVADDREVEKLAARVREFAEPSGFACPSCGGKCQESFVGDVSVDTCVSCHGVWLDAGEMEEAKRQVDVNRSLANAGPGFRDFLRKL